MFEKDQIVAQIRKNCDITDARHAGLYTICGLALRLRDLFKWENGLEPWVEKESAEVLEWIEAKEDLWEDLSESEFEDIVVDETAYDPFDSGSLNRAFLPHGFFYGSGHARFLKPTFFLAVVDRKTEIDGHSVYYLGKELARDLFTAPALTQDETVVVRLDSVKLFLWDQILYVNKSGRKALEFALSSYGQSLNDLAGVRQCFDDIAAAEAETYAFHELGELLDTTFDRQLWREMISAFPHTPIEMLVRTIKDMTADTGPSGMLPHIVKEEKTASLGFYVAFMAAFAKKIFPEIVVAFDRFTETEDWKTIGEAAEAGHRIAASYADTVSDLFVRGKEKNDMEWVKKEITRHLLAPLGMPATV